MTRRGRRWSSLAGSVVVAAATVVAVPTAAADVDAGPTVAVLGDSYSSGEGLRDAEGACGRASQAWGLQVADALGAGTADNLACTGAAVADVLVGGGGDDGDQPSAAQIEGLEPRDLVMLTVGGNDIGFSALVADCLDVDDQVRAAAATDDRSTAWQDAVASGQRALGCDTSPEEVAARVDELADEDRFALPGGGRGGLAEVYVAIAERAVADGGTLVVASYPALFHPPDEWAPRYVRRCHGVLDTDAAAFVDVTSALAALVSDEAQAADAVLGERARVVVADVHGAAAGRQPVDGTASAHGLCGPATPWVNGLTLIEGGVDPTVAASALLEGTTDLAALDVRPTASFHPSSAGHQGIAQVVLETVTATEAGGD